MKDLNIENIEGCVAAALPFPPISWWKKAIQCKNVYLDPYEHFQKMTFRNRYYLADKIGKSLLSIPLKNGRNQHLPMKELSISYAEDWQKNHWRTIQTLLSNSPFFEFIDFNLLPFYSSKEDNLYKWSKLSIEWANAFLEHPITILETSEYIADLGDNMLDLRTVIHPKNNNPSSDAYYQVFKNDIGFLEDCSIIDLICNEGKNAINILTANN